MDIGNTETGSNDAGTTDSKENVVSDTISEKPLPNTGGVPLLGLAVSGFFCISAGFLIFTLAIRRNP